MTTTTETEHRPVYLPREDYPGQIGQIGCACGHRPAKPAQSMNAMDASYRAHARKVNGAPVTAATITYLSGPFAGMTWEQRAAAETLAAEDCARCGNGPSAAYGDDVPSGHADAVCSACLIERAAELAQDNEPPSMGYLP